MNHEIQDQINKVNRFNENDSNKMVAIKKLLSSKFTLITLIVTIFTIAFYYVLCVVNQIINADVVDFKVILTAIGENLLNLIFPGIYIFCFIGIYKRSVDPTPSDGRNGLINKFFSLRNYCKLFYILNILGFVSNAFLYLNYETLAAQYPELFSSTITIEQDVLKNIGLYFLILTGLYTCSWYSLSRGSKKVLREIIFDTNEYKYIDLYIFIGFTILTPLLETIGTTISLFGINNPLSTIVFTEPIIFTDIMFLLYNVLMVASCILVGLLIHKLIIVLRNVKGSNNPLNDDEVVYTIHLDEDDK